MKIDRAWIDAYCPSFCTLDRKEWVDNDLSKLNANERQLLNFFMRHLFAYKNHTYPFYIPGNIEGENSLSINLKYKGITLSGSHNKDYRQRTEQNILKSLKSKGKLLMIKRYFPNSGKQFSTVFMPYPTIFLQPAFIPMLRIKFGNEKLDKSELRQKYFQTSLRSLDYKLRFKPGFTSIDFQQVADDIADSIWIASSKHLTINKNIRYNKNDISKQIFHIRDIFYKEELQENIKAFGNRND
tara:strand:+ start:520 stop:1242 length:723 start_codon:yes stop_codon:yes gene_type:complete